jgi:nucleotide-binding universal stress UspA family protein
MFKRIIVPLDGSAFAEAALAPAQTLAKRFNASMLLVRAVQPANLPRLVAVRGKGSPGGDAGLVDADDSLEYLDEADSYLDEVTRRLRDAKVDASYALFIAEPGVGIATTAELDHADLICMTAHQRWTLDLKRSDSTTLQVLARSRVPILAWRTVGPPLVGSGHTDTPARTPARTPSLGSEVPLAGPEFPILVPLDGSMVAESALPMAEQLAKALNAELVLVSATSEPDGTATQVYLDTMRDTLENRGLRVATVVRAGTAPSVIESARREYNAALIVMASHGSRGALLGFLGSVAGAIVEETDAPALVVRP